jgi:hypothetical protein
LTAFGIDGKLSVDISSFCSDLSVFFGGLCVLPSATTDTNAGRSHLWNDPHKITRASKRQSSLMMHLQKEMQVEFVKGIERENA